MIRKRTRNYSLNVAVPFIAILIAIFAPAALVAASQGPPLHFAKAATYDAGGYSPDSVAVGDLNGDGHPDLVVANWCQRLTCNNGNVSVLLGKGDGTFQAAVSYDSGGYGAASVAVADVNGDGKLDLVVANQNDLSGNPPAMVGVLLGNGDGTFQSAVLYDTASYSANGVAVADLNRDGKLDIVVTNLCQPTWYCSRGWDIGAVSVLLGNGDGTFQAADYYTTGGYDSFSIAIGNMNGDSFPDVVVVNFCADYDCNGDGSVSVLGATYDSGGPYPEAVAVGDVNGDGASDIVVANNGSVAVLLGDGFGHFRTAVSKRLGGGPNWVGIADMNRDGMPDIVAGGAVFLGNGDGTFQNAITLNWGGALAVSDVNGDGKPDVVVGPTWPVTNLIGVLLNTSGYATAAHVTSSLNPSFVNQSVTFTATVTSKSRTIPDGELVTFHEGTTTLASVPLAGGVASYTTSLLAARTHYIKATYAGDTTLKPSTGWVKQVVDKYPTTTALSSSPNPSAFGQTVTFTATVTPTGSYPPTGYVWFKDGTTGIGYIPMNGGVATLIRKRPAPGTHSITAEYMGNSANARSTSAILDQVVQ